MMTYQEQVSGITTQLEEILDLDDLEAKVYLNLLGMGPITASALAKELDIDRARMYRTVDKLVSRSIISTTISSPKLCIAAEPHDALKIALGKKEDEVNKIKKSGEAIMDKINEEITTNQITIVPTFRVVQGRQNIYADIAQLEKYLTIAKLKESLEKDYGEYDRSQYVIKKLQKDSVLPRSDHLYIERMIKLCNSVIEESEPKEFPEFVSSSDLIKCHRCDLQIELDEKSIRNNNFWFHDKCLEKILIVNTKVSQKIEKHPKVIRQTIRIESKPTYLKMAFSGGLLASVVGATYLLAGESVAAIVGIWGGILCFAIFESRIQKKRQLSKLKTCLRD